MILFVATNEGVAVIEGEGAEWELVRRGLAERKVTSIIAREGVVLAGTTEGVFRSGDGGTTWEQASAGLALPHVRWLAHHPAISDREFAGTEPAAIFLSRDGGDSWSERPAVSAMRRRFGWSLPYSPAAGCIRGFAFQGERGYAAAEDGALLRSDDGGETWALVPGSAGKVLHRPRPGQIHSDVHSVAVHPASPDLVVAPTGGGLFHSADGGESWQNRYRCYCRAVWWDPEDPQHLIFGAADGVDRYGRLEETFDGGESWHPAGSGAGDPWARYMVERLYQFSDRLFAVLSNGEMLVSPVASPAWQPFPLAPGWVNALAAELPSPPLSGPAEGNSLQ